MRLLVGRINLARLNHRRTNPLSGFRLFARRIGSGPWIVAAFCYLRTQAGLLALRGRLIMLRQTEEVTRR